MSSLNPKVFDEDVEQIAIRTGFGEGFLLAGKENPNVVGLCADLTDSTKMSLFKELFPERFIEVGVAEQNLASVASGMAAMGKIPFISSYAMFSPGRNWEQIRTTICYNNVNVKIAGSHAGVSVGPDGGTHQALEDIAVTRVLPRMTVISPCDAIEAKKATVAAAKLVGPTYIRLAREKTPVITTEETPFEIGKARIFYQGKKQAEVGIIATGALVHKALLAAKRLEADGISVKVLNLSTIKPLDKETVVSLARETHAIVTVEEHQIAAGMGSAVAECLARNYPIRMAFIGVDDKFGQSGKPEELIDYYGMGTDSIVDVVRKLRQGK
ncbi:MAG TPA: transketolase C-terminal domain-containing protein [Chthoniobacterales bacterium]|jgi:transketolase